MKKEFTVYQKDQISDKEFDALKTLTVELMEKLAAIHAVSGEFYSKDLKASFLNDDYIVTLKKDLNYGEENVWNALCEGMIGTARISFR